MMEQAETTTAIECSFCRSGFDDPRFLPCHDFFCMKCIKQLAQNAPFECPCCRTRVHISESEVEKLPVALAFKRIRERLSKTLSDTRSALHPPPTSPVSPSFHCEEHDIPLKLYCVDCDSPICPECALNRHASHQYDYIVKADGTHWSSVAEKELDQLKHETTKAFENVEKRRREYLERGVGLTQRLNETFDEMVAEVERRRDEVLEELSHAMQESLDSFREQEEALKVVENEVLDLGSVVMQQPAQTQADRKAHIARIAKVKERYARAISAQLPEDIPVSLQFNCIQEIRDICRVKMKTMLNDLSKSKAAQIAVSLTFKEATVSGDTGTEHRFNIPTPSSPPADVERPKPFVTLLGHTVRAITGLGKPHAIVISSKGQIVVSETHPNNRVKICDREGNELIKMKGRKLSNPMGIAVDQDGCVYVSERDANCVTKYDASGRFVKTTRGSKAVRFCHPRGIELVNNRLYVCDGGNHQIKILDTDLNFVDSFSAFVSQAPSHISASPNGLLYVASAVTPGVQVFTSDHKFIHTIACASRGPVCFDRHRNVLYVIDSDQGSVCQLRPDGTPLGMYRQMKEDEPLNNCSGIAVDQEGRVYVCNNNQISEYSLQAPV